MNDRLLLDGVDVPCDDLPVNKKVELASHYPSDPAQTHLSLSYLTQPGTCGTLHLRRLVKAHAALAEYRGDELLYLLLQGLVGDRLFQDPRELPVRALEARQELVPDELWSNLARGNGWCLVGCCWHVGSPITYV